MAGTPRSRLNILVKQINEELSGEYWLDWTAGKPRLVMRSGASGERDISPRLTTTQMDAWLGAFLDGIDAKKRNCGCE